MYSVIVPTLWIPDYFISTLISLCDHILVDEIIIIDNDNKKTPSAKILKHPKIKLLPQLSNIYVNPAWNLGVSVSKNDKICLLNDDLTFDLSIFDYLDDKINDNIGIIGLDMYGKNNIMNIHQVETRIFGFGCMMFFHKNSYYPIPEDLLVFYGDDYLVEMNKKMNKNNYVFTGVDNCQIHGTTSESGVIYIPEDPVNDKTKHLKYF